MIRDTIFNIKVTTSFRSLSAFNNVEIVSLTHMYVKEYETYCRALI